MDSNEKPLILIVDDNPQNLQFVGNLLLENEYEPAVTMNGSQALEFLKQEDPELILLDIMMPEMDGYEVCKRIKEDSSIQATPIIFLSAKMETEDVVKGFDLGAVDYITKPFNSAELLARVETHITLRLMQKKLEEQNILLQKEISIRKEAEAKLQELATTDYLTELFNRRHFMELSNREFERSKRRKQNLSLMMVDIDHFKSVNDTHGHDIGDEVLKALADVGRTSVRCYDIFARIGGEEFAILLPETNLANSAIVGERFRSAVEEAAVPTEKGEIKITVSIGAAMVTKETSDVDALLKKADVALYSAKQKGRNRVVLHGSE
ncbi:MAG: diguanylate cyclase [Desulfobacterales bacterium]|nr:diguanylate cyclase [Desulfobacterales bacterium]